MAKKPEPFRFNSMTKAELIKTVKALDTRQHAQCATCRNWGFGNQRCYWLQPNDVVTGKDSCGAYGQGKPKADAEPTGQYTKKDLGFVSHKVRGVLKGILDLLEDEL